MFCARRLVTFLVVISILSFWMQPLTANESGIEGMISVSPSHGGPVRVGVPNSRPLINTEFVVETDKGEVASFKTDDQGHFRVALAPGKYRVSKRAKSKIGFCGPFAVEIGPGEMTKVEWRCDSGMR